MTDTLRNPQLSGHGFRVSFRQVHTADGGRIRYRKVCEPAGRELEQAEITRGHESATGAPVPVTDQDPDNLPPPTAKAIDIVAFLPAEAHE